MNDPLAFSDSVVWVMGACGSVGVAVADAFLAAGATVLMSPVGPTAAAPGRGVELIACDSDDAQQIEQCASAIIDRHGRLDVLIADASDALDADPDAPQGADALIHRLLVSPLHVSQAANRAMQNQPGGGNIIYLVAKGCGPDSAGAGARAAARAGLTNLASSLAVEWAPRVRVNTVEVAVTQTVHRDEVADSCLFLASTMAAYISGTCLQLQANGTGCAQPG
jgi:NAD(P)-dependent dehydrogenase (short-subunit alcohol dehydrogenase family)